MPADPSRRQLVVPEFLDEVGLIAKALGLIVVGVDRSSHRIVYIEEAVWMAQNKSGLQRLESITFQVLTSHDYLFAWRRALVDRGPCQAGRQAEDVGADRYEPAEIFTRLASLGVPQRALATALWISPSYISHLRHGRMSWPRHMLAQAAEFVAGAEADVVANFEGPW